ncbi:MAG TPA: zf-HC2 domain-containing protein [Thermoanaerobaculia bacterium]|nr:zf-HC2 domain-containing protein [Thermoanaerobaculia bacterium]
MGCEVLKDRLSAYLDGELVEAGPVAAHLAGCASCRAALRDLRAASSLLAVTRGFAPDPSFVARFRRRLEALEIERTERWRLLALRLMPLAATALVAALALTVVERGRGPAEESFTALERTVLAAGSPPLRDAESEEAAGSELLLSATVDSSSVGGLRRADLRWP